MLSAEIYSSGLGFSFNPIKSVVGAVEKSADAAQGAIKSVGDVAKKTGEIAYDAGKAGVNAVNDAAKQFCKVATNNDVQKGANIASTYGAVIPSYGQLVQGAGQATQAAGAVCNLAYKPKTSAPTKLRSNLPYGITPEENAAFIAKQRAKRLAATAKTGPFATISARIITAHPPGQAAFQWFDKSTNKWKLAFPIQSQAALGAARPSPLRTPHGGSYRAGLWPRVVTTEQPYLAAYTQGVLGQTAQQYTIQTADAPAEGVPTVTQKEGEKRTETRPWYKKPLFWGAITAGVVGVGGATYLVIRRRRR